MGRKENLKSLFTNTRTRVIIIFTVILLATAVIFSYFKFRSATEVGAGGSTNVPNAPAIQSIPGALDPTAEYANLQQQQNIDQAKTALKSGSSAIPTIIRSQTVGAGVEAVGSQGGQSGVGFATLAREGQEGNLHNQWIQQLKNANCSQSTIQQIMQNGGQLADLRAACNCTQLKAGGFSVTALQPVCSCEELKAADFSAVQLKDAGFTAGQLRVCGFNACNLKSIGFEAQQMKDGGFSDDELRGAGYPESEITRASTLPNGINAADVLQANCDSAALARLRARGVSAPAVRAISGCSTAALKSAAYSAQDLRGAGFSAADLKNAGFTPNELHQAGFTARDLLNAGYSPADLQAAGYSPSDIAAGEAELPPGITSDSIRSAGCDVGALTIERLAGVSAKAIRQYANCNPQALKEAGFSDNDLANAGFTPQQIEATAPISDDAIRAAACDPTKLRLLMQHGVSASRIHELNGCNAQGLKAVGFSARDLLNAGLTPQDLLAAGYNPDEIQAAGASTDNAIRNADCDPTKLRTLLNTGISAKTIRQSNNCSAAALRAAGYDSRSLLGAGFTPEQLLNSGFSPSDLSASGMATPAAIATGRTANCSVASLTAARESGVSAATIKNTLGCSSAALKAAGYSAGDLRTAGFTAADLKNPGFSLQQLKAAGSSARDLLAAGFRPQQLLESGYTATQLKTAGLDAQALRAAGLSANDLKNAGFTPKELHDAGFAANDLKATGFSLPDLRNAGFTAAQLRLAGFTPTDLMQGGVPASDIQQAGYSNNALQGAGIFNEPTSPPQPGVIPGIASNNAITPGQAESSKQLQAILNQQNARLADQRYQQRIQQRTTDMLNEANQAIQGWGRIATQTYMAGTEPRERPGVMQQQANGMPSIQPMETSTTMVTDSSNQAGFIKAGDVIFAVIDTSINSDEPGPILATVVSGKLKGAKLIGSFNLPSNSDKLIITFNTLSIPGAGKTMSINALAIDPNTARTALSSDTNHHYLYRYGSLFASSFMEGIGNAFQSADTSVTVGGTGGGDNITVQNGINRSILQNTVIALTSVGKAWGQFAQQQFNTPTTVQVYSGTAIGVLFTQDLSSIS